MPVKITFVRHAKLTVNLPQVRKTLQRVFADHGRTSGQLIVAIVDDPTSRSVNRSHLAHDFPTDVITFDYLESDTEKFANPKLKKIDAELVVSADHAKRLGKKVGHGAATEFLLYCVHGALHLVGYDDQTKSKRNIMWKKQLEYIAFYVGLKGG